jgi:hypothetical protein
VIALTELERVVCEETRRAQPEQLEWQEMIRREERTRDNNRRGEEGKQEDGRV